MKLLFCAGLAWLAYVFVGYPAILWILARFRRFHVARGETFCPSVSVLIAARNEEKDIGWKIRETLAWDYPPERLEVLVASDASDDSTDGILAGITNARFKFIRMKRRGGKQVALNALATLASGDLLFFTDANTHIGPAVLRTMASYFADKRVGCVTGIEQGACAKDECAVACGTRSYLGYEAWLNAAESRLGSVLVCDGSIFALRRSLFTPLQTDIANDLESPLRVGGTGSAVLFDSTLRSFERATSSPWQEFARRRRICAQGLLGMWRLRPVLHGLRLWQFVSRKFLRWLLLFPLLAIAFSSTVLIRQPIFAVFVAVEVTFVSLALVGCLAAATSKNVGALFTLPFYFLLVNLAAFLGVVDTCQGRRFGVWEQPSSSRGLDAAEPDSSVTWSH